MIEKIIQIVRPSVTWLFAGAIVYFAAIKILPIDVFVPIAAVAIVWWYKDREAEKQRKATEKAKENS